MTGFLPGLELSRRFYTEAVRPILEGVAPGLPHAAARIGSGSDVLGFDTEMSMDHDWGPRAQLFLREEDRGLAERIDEALRARLPHSFLGFPVDMDDVPGEPGNTRMTARGEGPVRHQVVVTTPRAYARERLGCDPGGALGAADWLSLPSQALLELTAGAVFHDGVGELRALRERLSYYPRDVWLYLMAAGWKRIGQEEPLMPRAGFVGDELGSAVIGARLVRDVMSLCFLQARRYAPYPKWFGSAFGRLPCAAALSPCLARALRAEAWREREAALCEAYEQLARAHNRLGLTAPLPERVSAFHGRPFRVIHGDAFCDALLAQIEDPVVQALAARRPIGGVDQLSDSTDLRCDRSRRGALRALYDEPA